MCSQRCSYEKYSWKNFWTAREKRRDPEGAGKDRVAFHVPLEQSRVLANQSRKMEGEVNLPTMTQKWN